MRKPRQTRKANPNVHVEDTITIHLGYGLSPEKVEEITKYIVACMNLKYPHITNLLDS